MINQICHDLELRRLLIKDLVFKLNEENPSLAAKSTEDLKRLLRVTKTIVVPVSKIDAVYKVMAQIELCLVQRLFNWKPIRKVQVR